MRFNYVLLGLITLTLVIGMYMASSPDQAERLDAMRREAAFTGEARELVLALLALGIGGFIAYLTLTRR